LDSQDASPDLYNVTLSDAIQEAASGGASFSIAFLEIDELSTGGQQVYTASLQNKTYSRSRSNVNTYTYHLANGALVEVAVTTYDAPADIDIYNNTVDVSSSSIQKSMRITNWPFDEVGNTLQVRLLSLGNSNGPACCTTVKQGLDTSSNLQWLQVTVSGVVLFGSFFEDAMSDSSHSLVKYSYSQADSVVVASIPYFWEETSFTTVFTVLTNDKIGCFCWKEKDAAYIGGVVGGVFGAATIAGAIAAFLLHKRSQRHKLNLEFPDNDLIEQGHCCM
jgi:hypothetical protein